MWACTKCNVWVCASDYIFKDRSALDRSAECLHNITIQNITAVRLFFIPFFYFLMEMSTVYKLVSEQADHLVLSDNLYGYNNAIPTRERPQDV